MDIAGVTSFTILRLQLFALVAARVSGIFVLAPFFGNNRIPAQIKIGLCILLTFIIFPLVRMPSTGLSDDILGYAFELVRELMVGLVIGYAGALIFAGVQLAGQLIDMQIGFGMANIVDPMSNIQVSLIAQVKILIATLLFIASNGHHIFLSGVAASFDTLPVGQAVMTTLLMKNVITIFTGLFVIAVKLSVPVLMALLLTDAALGILARTVPQMNIMVVGFPIKIAIGLFTMAAMLPAFGIIFSRLIPQLQRDIASLMKVMSK